MKATIQYIENVGFLLIGLLFIFLINPFEKGYLAGYLLTALIYLKKDFLLKSLDLDYVMLLVFSIVYALTFAFTMKPGQGMQDILFYGFFPCTFYLIGKYLAQKNIPHKGLFYLLFAIGFIFSFSALISVLLNLKSGGFVQFERSIPMFWNGKIVSATLMGAYLTFNMCIPAILISKGGKLNMPFKITASLIFIVTLLCVFRLGSRTQLVITAATILFSLLFVIPNQSIKANLKLLVILGLGAVFIMNFFSFDLEADYLSTLGQRLQEGSDNSGSAGGRTERWAKSLENLFTKPFGWSLNEFGYSHNMWLDVARYAGIVPFLLLVVFTIRSFFNIRKALKLYPKELLLNTTILVYSIALFLIFFVEPIMEGLFNLFVVFCLFQGIINAYNINFKKTTLN